jgi:hypothetical protein
MGHWLGQRQQLQYQFFFVSDANGVAEDLILHRLLTENALKLSHLSLKLADFGGTDDLVIGTIGFTASLGNTTFPGKQLAWRYPAILRYVRDRHSRPVRLFN